MKHILALSVSGLLLLSACGGGTVVSPTPTPEPEPVSSVPLPSVQTPGLGWAPGAKALPDQLVSSGAELWSGRSIYLLAQLPEADIALYGLESDQLVLRMGDSCQRYDLRWQTPRTFLPQLFQGDYDADGAKELLLLTYTGSGTGVNSWTLTVLETEGSSWSALTLPDSSWEEALAPFLSCRIEPQEEQITLAMGSQGLAVDLPDFADSAAPIDAYAGPIVEYQVEGDSITARLAVGLHQEEHIPWTAHYVADLQGRLVYDGQGFSLADPLLEGYSTP